MKKIFKAICLLTALSMLAGCSAEETVRPELLEAANVRLESALVERRDLSDMKLYNAQLLPETVELGFEVDGYLYGLYAEAGETVGEGTVLAAIVGPNYSKIQNLEDEIEDLEASNKETYEALETELEIARLAGDDTAELELELKHQKERSELELVEKQNRLDEMKADDIGYIYITAPYDCTVVAVTSSRTGGFVSAGTPVVALDGGGDFTLTCDYISESAVNSAYRCYALINGGEYELEYHAYTKEELRIMSANSVTPVSRFSISGSTEGLECGDYCVVVYVSDMKEDVLVVPQSAVYSDTSGKYVYEIVDNSRVKREVTTGISDSTYIEIVSGIEEGASVYVKN